MMDLDRFKGYNDRNGHPAGDELLVAVSRAIESCIRQGDRAYRYGGDEFAVILPDCRPPGGRGGRPADPRRHRGDPRRERRPARHDQRRHRLPPGGRDRQGEPRRDRRPGPVPGQGRAVPELARPVRGRPRRDGDGPARRQRHRGAARLDPDPRRPPPRRPHGYVYLGEPGDTHVTVRAGDRRHGRLRRLPDARRARASAGTVFRTGKPSSSTTTTPSRAARPTFAGKVGAGVGVPLTVGGRVVGVLGLVVGTRAERVFRQPEVDALHEVRAARLDRARERPPPRAGAVAARPGHGPADARDAHPAGRRGARRRRRPATEREPVAVLLLDVDRFEIVNESLGHAAGDRVLREVGRRIAAVLGPADTVATIRWRHVRRAPAGPATPTQALAFAERVQLELKPPFDLDGRTWFISASMGIAIGAPGSSRRRRRAPGGRDRARRREARPDAAGSRCSTRSAAATPSSASTSRPSCGPPSSATS